MKSKIWQKIVIGAVALTIPFALAACNPANDGNTDGDNQYGSLDDFFKDFFDDWDSENKPGNVATDWTELYGEKGKKDDYINGTSGGVFDPEQGTYFYEAEYTTFEYPARVLYGEGSSNKLQLEYCEAGTFMALDVYAAKDCTALLGLALGCSSSKYTADLFTISYTDESGENSGLVKIDGYTFAGNGWLNFTEQSIGEVPLKAGKNTITVNSLGGFNLDYFVLTPRTADVVGKKADTHEFTSQTEWAEVYGAYELNEYLRGERVTEGFDPTWGAYKYEAESAKLFGGTAVNADSKKASGGATVKTDSTGVIDFIIESKAECEVLVKAAVATGANYTATAVGKLMKVGVIGGDGATGATEPLKGTNGFNDTPAENDLGVLRLKKGKNVLRIEPLVMNAVELDYLAILPVKANITGNPDYDPNAGYTVPVSQWENVYGKYRRSDYVSGKTNAFDPKKGAHIYEAEEAVLGEGLYTEGLKYNGTNKPNASGNGQVGGFNAQHHTVTFEIQSTREYTALISLGYTSAPGFSQYLYADSFITVTYNGGTVVKNEDSKIVAGDWTGDGIYVESYIGEITLKEGVNTVVVDCFNMAFPNTVCLDYLLLSPRQADAEVEGRASYTVTYDLNGGVGSVASDEFYEGDSFALESGDMISKTGYSFVGWSYNDVIYSGGDMFTMPNSAVTFVAVWVEDPIPAWTEKYGTYDRESYVTGEDNYFAPKRGAYIYEAENATLGSRLNTEDKDGASGGKVVSGFGENERTISFDVYSTTEYTALISLGYTLGKVFGTAGMANRYMTVTCGSQKVYCSATKLNAGDWKADPNVFTESYIGEIKLSKGKNTIVFKMSNMVFPDCMALDYLLILPAKSDVGQVSAHNVVFDVNGGTGSVDSKSLYVGEILSVPSGDGLAKDGFYFAGWSAGGSEYAAGDVYVMPDNDVTFIAIWEESREYNVTYDLNGGIGNIQNGTCMSGNDLTLPSGDGLEKTGFKFGGWLHGDKYCKGGATVKMPSEDVKFDALWLATSGNRNNVYGDNADKLYNKVTPSEKTFGFNASIGTHIYEAEDAELGSGLNVERGKQNASGNAQVTGFTSDAKTFKYRVNAAQSGTALITVAYTGNKLFDVTKPASNYMSVKNGGFELDCSDITLTAADWNGGANGKGLYVEVRLGIVYLNRGENILEFSFKDMYDTNAIGLDYILLTPETSAVAQKHTVTFDLDGGTGTVTGVAQSYPEGATFTLPSASGIVKTGYEFDCWNDGTTDLAAGSTYIMGTADVTFTAKWIKLHACESVCPVCEKCTNDACEEEVCGDKCPKHFTVTFELNGGTGTVTGFDGTFNDGAEINLPSADGIIKEGFVLDGWNDGTKNYSLGVAYTVKGDVVFTAVWREQTAPEPEKFDVIFEIGDASGEITGIAASYKQGDEFNLPSGVGLFKDGWAFDCWTDGTTDYAGGAKFTMQGKSVTFTAKWTQAWEKLYGKTCFDYTDASTFAGNYVSGKNNGFNPARGSFVYEGEDTAYGAAGFTLDSKPGASGGKVLNGFDGNKHTMTFEVYSTCDNTALLSLAYTGAPGFGVVHTKADHYFTITNTSNSTTVSCSDTDLHAPDWWASNCKFIENYIGEIVLAKGINIITVDTINCAWNSTKELNECIQIDYMLLTPKYYDVKSALAQYSVTFEVGEGVTGTVESVEHYEGAIFYLPNGDGLENGDKFLLGWTDGEKIYGANEMFVMPAESVTFTAVWSEVWEELYGKVNGSMNSGDGTYDQSSYISGENNRFNPERGTFIYEAESAKLGSGLKPQSTAAKAPASGGTVLDGFDTATRTVTFTVYSTCEYTALLSLGYTSGTTFGQGNKAAHYFNIVYGGDKKVICTDTSLYSGNWTASPNVFVENYIGEITLTAGENIIVVNCFNMTYPAGFQLDYMALTPKASDVAENPTQYAVTFDLDGGSDPNGSVQTAEHYEGAVFALPAGSDLVKDGYYFDGWTFDSKTYAAGDKFVMPRNAVEFTVIWKQSPSHTVTFDLKGGTGTGLISSLMEGQKTILPKDGIVKENYTLAYWENGGKLYLAGVAEFTMLTEDVTFNAVWLANKNIWDTVYGAADPDKNYTKTDNSGTVNKENAELEFSYDAQNGSHLYEAEASERLHTGLSIEGVDGNGANKANASGEHQLAGFNTDARAFSFKINAAQSGTALLTVCYTGNPNTDLTKPVSYYMEISNGDYVLDCSDIFLTQANWGGGENNNGLYVELRLGVFFLNEGINNITFRFKNWTWPNAIAMDYILLTPETSATAQPSASIPPDSSDDRAEIAYIREDERAES